MSGLAVDIVDIRQVLDSVQFIVQALLTLLLAPQEE